MIRMKAIDGDGYIKGIRQNITVCDLKPGDIIRHGEKMGVVVGFWNKEDYMTNPIVWVLKEGQKGIGYYRKEDVRIGCLEFVKRPDNPDITPKGLRAILKREAKEYHKILRET